MQGQLYAAAVSDGAALYRVLLVRRDPRSDVYVAMLGAAASGMNPHASQHRDGRGHQKSFDYGFFEWHGDKPDATFSGARNLLTTGLAKRDPYAINQRCDPDRYAGLLVIPHDEVSAETNRTHLSVDLVSPGHDPLLIPGAEIRHQVVFKDALPWIVITFFAW